MERRGCPLLWARPKRAFLGLSDKTGGKKFSKEFEEASAKLEEFVNSLDKQVKDGPSLTEVLENAGIFYEAQYKEVKVVANVSLQEHTNTPTPTTCPGASPGVARPSWGEAHQASCSSVRLATKAEPNGMAGLPPQLEAVFGPLQVDFGGAPETGPPSLPVASSDGFLPCVALNWLLPPCLLLTLLCFPPSGLQDLRQPSEQPQEEAGPAQGHPS